MATGSTSAALVTGGAGFIGSHLVEALLGRGERVRVLDDFSTGRRENLGCVLEHPRLELVHGDVRDEALVDELTRGADRVYHLAAAVGVDLILADPFGCLDTNVRGTESVLRAAAASGAKVVIASTSEVYGKVVCLPQREDDDVLIGPTSVGRWLYAATKMVDEFAARAYASKGVESVVFRLFNTVGPRQTGAYGMVVPRFVEAALAGQPLRVFGDGTQRRSFLHVTDAVDAILRLGDAPSAVGEVVNVGSCEAVTILELARRVLDTVARLDGGRRLSGWSPIVLVPYYEAFPRGDYEDVPARLPATYKIERLVGWRPQRRLDDILRDVVLEKLEVAHEDEEPLARNA
jgi:UDP-glucose 4-epimerase